MNIDQEVDIWVESINASAHRRDWDYLVPPSVRFGPPDDFDEYDWRIRKLEGINWIEPLEANLLQPFPGSFRSLVSRYVFPSLENKHVWLFANTPEGIEPHHELRTGIFEDKFLSEFLLERGFVQFGRASGENYDPLCFNTTIKSQNDEFPIAQIDHEAVLCKSKLRIAKEISPSFVHLVAAWFED